MSFAYPGFTHCEKCGSTLSMNEAGLCERCKEKVLDECKKEVKMESNFTIIEASEFAQNEYGHCYGSSTLRISKEDIAALLNGKQLAWDDGEYTTFILFEDTELNTEVNTNLN